MDTAVVGQDSAMDTAVMGQGQDMDTAVMGQGQCHEHTGYGAHCCFTPLAQMGWTS